MEISLNKHNTSTDLNYAIGNITYNQEEAGTTNLPEGLCHLTEEFKEGNGARPLSAGEVFRVAIILFDGMPNIDIKFCRVNDTTYIEEAEILRTLPKIGVYVIGVTDNINDEVLNAIASKPTSKYVTHLDYFSELPDAHERCVYDICKRGKGVHA